jgi:hypothetical protein
MFRGDYKIRGIMNKLLKKLAPILFLVILVIPDHAVHSNTLNEDHFVSPVFVDSFGYQLTRKDTFEWEDIAATGEEFETELYDDAMFRRSIPFNFKFYEMTYTQLNFSVDGVMVLANHQNDPENMPDFRPLPTSDLPNAVIAPFWQDLVLWLEGDEDDDEKKGKIYHKSFGNYVIVQWEGVYRKTTSSPLTFQVKISQSGDIQFNYKTLDSVIPNIPIGIEDSDGIDGLQYQYDVNEFTSNTSLLIKRPPDGARVKVMPSYQGGFMNKQIARFEFTVINTGTVDDNFTLEQKIIDGNELWGARFLRMTQSGYVQISQTGLIEKNGGETQITVELNSKFSPIAGDYATAAITLRSTNNPEKTSEVIVQGAVPTNFAKVAVAESLGMQAGIWYRYQANDIFVKIQGLSSDNPSILRAGSSRYYLLSDNRDSGDASNIEYVEINTLYEHESVGPINHIANNIDKVRDLNPAAAINADGVLGIVFIREKSDETGFMINTNIWFAAVIPGYGLIGPFPITTNTSFGIQDQEGVSIHTSPTISATENDRFTLVWVDKNKLGNGQKVYDLKKTSVSVNPDKRGITYFPPSNLTDSQSDHRLYQNPAMTTLRAGGSAVVAAYKDTSVNEYRFELFYLNNTGSKGEHFSFEQGMQGVHPDIVQLRNGNLFIGYTHPTFSGIGYGLVTHDKTVHRCELPAVAGDKLDHVSVTSDAGGNGVLTWADRTSKIHYYSLVAPAAPQNNHECQLITPPMMFGTWWISGIEGHENNTTASLGSPNLFIPLIGQ